nr:unnamed protein product [Spirometra erinaceieuropaei]
MLADVDEFLVREGRWRERMPLAVARCFHAAAVVNVPATAAAGEKTLIGAFCGLGGDGCLSSCELYDVSQDRWHKLPDLPEKRSGPAAACLPDECRVFVFGGFDESFCGLLPSAGGLAGTGDLSRLLAASGSHENCAIAPRSDALSGSNPGRRWIRWPKNSQHGGNVLAARRQLTPLVSGQRLPA